MSREERKDVGKAKTERLILVEEAARGGVRVTMAKPIGPDLSPEQKKALDRIRDWYATGSGVAGAGAVFRLFGAAGTGKTTLARHLAGALGADIVYGAYTGKAAHVLRNKGVPATTIHSAIYHPVDNKEARAQHRAVQADLADVVASGVLDTEPAARTRKEELERELADLEQAIHQGVEFELNPMSEWADADLIVLDEVSMVNENLARDIESFGVPILVLGDPHQLPPVDGGGYYTNARPDVLLDEVHRFYSDSPVGSLATAVRQGGSWQDRLVKVDLEQAMAADQVICWKNATRHAITAAMRKRRGSPAGAPVPGDRVMCLVNNKDIGVFNGQQFEVLEVDAKADEFFLRDDDGQTRWYTYDPDGFRGQDGEQEAKGRRRFRGKVGLFTFADVITCHKAQGSEWPHVYVVDQTHQMWRNTDADKRRWVYTACTRAQEQITLASTEVR